MNLSRLPPRIMLGAHRGLRYAFEVYDPRTGRIDRGIAHNLVPTEGLTLALNVLLHAIAAPAAWYVAPFKGVYTPTLGVTAATFPSLATELTGYAESTRVEYQEGAASGGAINGTPCAFTSNADDTIRGFALLSAPAKGSTSGYLLSIAQTPSPIAFPGGAVVRCNVLGAAQNP